MRSDLDFARIAAALTIGVETCLHFAEYVKAYPEHVTAVACSYLAITRFLTWFRKA